VSFYVLVNTILFDRPEGFPGFIQFFSVLSGKSKRKALESRDCAQFRNFLPTNLKKPVSFFQTEVYSTGKQSRLTPALYTVWLAGVIPRASANAKSQCDRASVSRRSCRFRQFLKLSVKICDLSLSRLSFCPGIRGWSDSRDLKDCFRVFGFTLEPEYPILDNAS
jgi:hypothetical protein